MILTPDQLRDLAASVGFPDPTLAAAVAMGESYGHSDALNVVTPSQARERTAADPAHPVGPEWSVGIWQINACARWQDDSCVSWRYDQSNLLDPTYNAQVAYALWSMRGWAPWGAYTNGGYRQYLPSGYVPIPVPPPPAPWAPEPITPPQRRGDGTAVAIVAGLSLAAAAGYAAFRQRRELEYHR